MNLEQRPVQFEDVARQVLSRGKREHAQYYFDRIESITEDDIKRVANRMLSSNPAIAALGRVGSYDPTEQITKILNSSEEKGQSNKVAQSKFKKLISLIDNSK